MLLFIVAVLYLGLPHVPAFLSKVKSYHHDRRWLLHSTTPTTAEKQVALIRETVMGMKTGDIKKALINKGADTRGLFDKADLAALLIKIESSASVSTSSVGKVTSIPIYDVPLGAATQTYVGIDLMIKGEKMRFMVGLFSFQLLFLPITHYYHSFRFLCSTTGRWTLVLP